MRYAHVATGAALALLASACSGSRTSVIPRATGNQPVFSGAHTAAVSTSGTYPTAVLANQPVAYYRLGDQGTSVATDSSGNNHIGAYHGLGTALTQGTAGLITGDTTTSTADNGNSAGSVTAGRSTAFESGSSISLEAWVDLSAISKSQTLAEYGNRSSGSFRGYALDYDATRQSFAFKIAISSGVNTYTLSEPASGIGHAPATGTIYHLVGTYDGASEKLYVNGQLASSVSISGPIGYAPAIKNAGVILFEDVNTTSPSSGALQEVAFYNTPLPASTVLAHYNAGTGAPPPTPSPTPPPTPPPTSPAYSDWSTFGDDLQRTNYNPNETTLSASNVASLKLSWSVDLGSAITDQPVIATNVPINGTPTTVAYIGTEAGQFYALNADTGATITPGWPKSLGTVATGCLDLPGGTFGITGTPTYDRTTNRIYVADGKDQVHALNMSTGAEVSGWPVTVANTFTSDHIYGALTFNPSNGLLYVETASFCDNPTWNGRIVAINTSTAAITATFYPAMPYNGAGIWGIGGVSVDATGDGGINLATGNDVNAPTEYSAYGENVVHLSSSLGVVGANYPGITGGDEDFGATPMLYAPGSCPKLISVKNKSGIFLTYNQTSVGSGPIQTITMAPVTSAGQFIGTTAYSPVQNLVYVGDPVGNATYTHGLIALAPQSDCTLAYAWEQMTGPANTPLETNYSATVANGVVYFTDGQDDHVFAFDAATGTPLWNNTMAGVAIGGPVMVAPTVDGRLFVSSWDHHLYAFGL